MTPTERLNAIRELGEHDEKTKLAIEACRAIGFDLEDVLRSRLDAYAAAEETFFVNEGLKIGVREFVKSIKANIVDQPMFPADMRLMAKMLIADSDVVREIEKEKDRTLQIEGPHDGQ